ncbi:hypothetical protein [Providencia manganoxydans]|uniref:hypothetical protein n=1 Tax=Providencia manganoxydans TaxID=2923283 RepID=UPI0034DD8F66
MSKPTGKLIRVTPEGIGAVSSGRKVNNKPLTADITLNATDVGAYTKAESDTKIADAKKAGTDAQSTANTANTNATNANNNANGRVPNTRKINNKPLSADITLTAGDVGAYTKAEVDNKISGSTGVGYGQKWSNVTASRAKNTEYINTTSKPIYISISIQARGVEYDDRMELIVDAVSVARSGIEGNYPTFVRGSLFAIIPVGSKYKVVGTPNIEVWSELR